MIQAAEKMIAHCLHYAKGHFQFRCVEEVPGFIHQHPIHLSVISVLFEMFRLVDDRATIEQVLPSSNNIYSIIEDAHQCRSMLHLLPEEEAVLACLDGMRSIQDIAGTQEVELFEISKIVYRFMQIGLLERVGELEHAHE